MQSLLTGYALNYNHRHRRTGKLYQNRFKSVLCDKNEYFRRLVRYIHLNPIRGGVVPDLKTLDKYPWTGHSVVMGKRKADWLETGEILQHFGKDAREARRGYRQYLQRGLTDDEDWEQLRGGGLIRSVGGAWELAKLKASGSENREAGDERILGSGAFVQAVLDHAEEQEKRTSRLRRDGWSYERVREHVCELFGIEPADLKARGVKSAVSRGRALLSKWMVEDLGWSRSDVAERLGVTRTAMTKLVKRGRNVESDTDARLE
jgi:hypothetical protein